MKKLLAFLLVLTILATSLLICVPVLGEDVDRQILVEDTYVYDFMRGEDGTFDSFPIAVVTVFEDGTTFEEDRSYRRNGNVECNYASLLFCDNQDEVTWEVGNVYEVSYGTDCSFSVEVRPTPVVDIDIADCNYCFYNPELEEYRYYPQCTVYYVDGTVETTGNQSISIELADGCWYSYDIQYIDTQGEEDWLLGNTYEVTAEIFGLTDTFSVTVVTVADFEADPRVYLKGTQDVPSKGYDAEGNLVKCMEYNVNPQYITVTFTDGSCLSGSVWEIEEATGVYAWAYSDQSWDNPWDVGSHQATVVFGYIEKPYTIEIVDSPIASLYISDVSVIEYSNGDYQDGQFYYSPPYIDVKITLKDGTEITEETGLEFLGEWYYIEDNAWSLQEQEPWTAGNTYAVTAEILGVSYTYNVTVVKAPIKSLEIHDMTLIEGVDGYFSEGNFYYSIPNICATVVLDDGTVMESDFSYIEINGNEGWFTCNEDVLQQQELWTVGNTYTVTGEVFGVSDTFLVTIQPSPVKKIVIEDVFLYEGIDAYYDNMDGQYWYYFDLNLTEIMLADGTYVPAEYGHGFTYNGIYFGVSDNAWDMQYEQPWTAGNTYEVTGSLLGAYTTFSVTILEHPIEEIKLIKAPDKLEYLEGESVDLKGSVIRICYADGTSEDITIRDPYSAGYRRSYFSKVINRDTEIYHYQEDNQTAVIELFGKQCKFPITVKGNQIANISIQENEDCSISIIAYNSDNTSFEMKVLDLCYCDWMDENEYYAGFLTDKGQFSGKIIVKDNRFSIGLFLGEEEERYVQSNTLFSHRWFDLMQLQRECFFGWISERRGRSLDFDGTVNEENIDDIIKIAGEMSSLWWDEDKIIERGDDGIPFGIFRGKDIRESVSKSFVITDMDLTLSEQYDKQTDTYKYYYPQIGGGDYRKWRPGEIERTKDGWVVTAVLGYSGTVLTFGVNNDLKINSLSIHASEERISSVSITQMPDKCNYRPGESFEKKGLVVTGICETGEKITVTGYTLSGYDATPGVKTITVTYGGQSATFQVQVGAGSRGDLDGDQEINAKDALLVLQIAVGKVVATPEQRVAADVNGDDAVDATDALEILKYAVGKPSVLK